MTQLGKSSKLLAKRDTVGAHTHHKRHDGQAADTAETDAHTHLLRKTFTTFFRKKSSTLGRTSRSTQDRKGAFSETRCQNTSPSVDTSVYRMVRSASMASRPLAACRQRGVKGGSVGGATGGQR
eukprot:1185597-Prorocentrum_minimum.AAC.7